MKLIELINKNKKKIIIGASTFMFLVVGGTVTGITFIYKKAKSNINYSIEEAKVIALEAVEGEVIKSKRKLELDEISFNYEFKIKDSNKILREVTVDATLGAITDIDNYYD